MPQHSPGVRAIFERVLHERGVTLLAGKEVARASETHLHCTDGSAIEYDEVIWRARHAAPRRRRAAATPHCAPRMLPPHAPTPPRLASPS